ncbi:hypothetical protein Ddye_000765 [Dipteronia dyeriana]|uniref:Uncharacterized protein n=1 Tax=Dipteronia dyeriana TaxID=168575 RepID=A0AAD9XMA3_9ROSI|nr:hypothetical protein Ddye_000765 [Dipteronia dyeriana]
MYLKEQLTQMSRGTKHVVKYLQTMKDTLDELTLVDVPLSDDDLTIHVLNSIGYEFKKIATAIKARECLITFEELHDNLIEHVTFLKHQEIQSDSPQITAIKTCTFGHQGFNSKCDNTENQNRKINNNRGQNHDHRNNVPLLGD